MARLDKDPPERDSAFANTASISESDRALLDSDTGRAPSEGEVGASGSIEEEEIRDASVGTRPVDDRTDFHLSGTGGIETDDGLDETAEMVRAETEDTTDDPPSEAEADVPVFDRSDRL